MFNNISPEIMTAYERFWNRENTDRAILNFYFPENGATAPNPPSSLEQKWLDEEYIVYSYKHTVKNTGYVAEGVPAHFTNLGPGCLAACIGGSFELGPDTVWFDHDPVIKDWDDMPLIAFDESSEMWQHISRIQNRLASEPDVDFSMVDIGGTMDVLAALRSTEELLYDLYDYPEKVKELAKSISRIWIDMYDRQVDILRQSNRPFNTWMNIPSLKPWYPLQCDFSYMISPMHFEEFVLPDLIKHADHTERSIYHLDGVGELPHLDMILDVDRIGGIQWVPGAGQSPMYDPKWFDLYRRIQDKKKNLVIYYGIDENDVAGVERLIKSIDPRGTYICAYFSCREKAEDMAEKITRWSE